MVEKTLTLKPATPRTVADRTFLPKTSPAKNAANIPLPTKVVTVSGPLISEPDLKKKELIDLVVARSGIKKKDAKPTVEAILAILGETIARGRELNLQPLGKLRINRSEEKSNARVIVCKLRQRIVNRPQRDNVLAPTVD